MPMKYCRKREEKPFIAHFHEQTPLNVNCTFFSLTFFRWAVNEKAECVAKCTAQVCTSLIEETLNADVALIVEEILDAELQRIHQYIKR